VELVDVRGAEGVVGRSERLDAAEVVDKVAGGDGGDLGERHGIGRRQKGGLDLAE
jgi:hypothetical protein